MFSGVLYSNMLIYRGLICLLSVFVLILKVPSYPFYFWLPEAHVEISWLGSVILASIVLKYSVCIDALFYDVFNVPIYYLCINIKFIKCC
jgi:formate hydrogenlyase subunit 3/multisubunit Na+/H+ antiporter MnhD subunit